MSMLTGREIAQAAGVSQATVSRVVQGSARVSEKNRRRVEEAMAKYGYVPNAQARAMRTQRSGVIGVIVGEFTNPWYPVMMYALAREIARADLRINFWVSDGENSEQAAIEAIRSKLIDGLIFTTATRDSQALPTALELGLPVVLVNRSLENITSDQVTGDNVGGGAAVATYFLAHDRTRVAVVGGGPWVSTGRERRKGFLDVFHDAGIHIPPTHIPETAFTHQAGLDAGRVLLANDPPQAIFCTTDIIAFGVIDAAMERGMRVPEDLWVTGYDDIPMSAWRVLDLTTVRQPIDDMARLSLEILLARIEDPNAAVAEKRFATELVVRGSTGNMAR
ncbi:MULTISPECIES: LacI family DNA-binding transcriptional regulator [unclassified Nesterenkonia]|uniref:LacI family DNA-binding transcriptional regulator n=1 Tax=unclassified Nesterenkonia TaxID=2629769 RepID=UPI001F4C9C07|nr:MULTISPECIES: LacI family DNA-binding transcriptional regulator [unclassified Nesterenkonia]MCH8559256.1 LacI family transcriptional regulator [Nesterenkonia sp. DZ6]MCH8571601.1 LacI family transcriptional regulator [Nesterenkonia sp. AY15]